MKNYNIKNGFTIVELLAVFVILGIIATIAVPSINKIKKEYAKSSFLESAKGVISSAQTYYAENEYEEFPQDGLEISDKKIKIKNKNKYISGVIFYNSAIGQFELQLLSDGDYCANGTLDDLEISEGTCKTKDECFIFNEGSNTIEKYNFDDDSCPNYVAIPEKINNVTVKNIGDNAFTDTINGFYCSTDDFKTGREELSSYTHSIDEKCILNDLYNENSLITKLKSVSLPKTIETIGENSFAGSDIKSLNLSKNNNLTMIKTGAFMGSSNLQSIELSNMNNINIIDAYSFSDTYLKKFKFNNLKNLTYIGTGSFTNTAIEDVDLTNCDKLKYIGMGSFYGIQTASINLQFGDKSKIEYLGTNAFCNSNFMIQGWTNLDSNTTVDSLTNACLNSLIK